MAHGAEAERQRPTVQHQEANNLTIVAKAHWEIADHGWLARASFQTLGSLLEFDGKLQ